MQVGSFGESTEEVFVFFFKQKTAYEVKECDWSSDVCSSDLLSLRGNHLLLSIDRQQNLAVDEKGLPLMRICNFELLKRM